MKETCPSCGSPEATRKPHVEKFTYGVGESAVELEAHVTLISCPACGEDFLDAAAHEEMERVVQEHLKGES